MKCGGVILILVTLCACGAEASDLVPFAMPWDDGAPGPTDLRATIEKPAGKSGFVCVAGGQLYAGERRLRLFGANLTAGACFPDHATADKVAARMAKFGLNAVRLHFLDSTWGSPRLIKYESGDWGNWDAEALDRLDYFIARLKEHGIYVNLNLLVGRRFGVGDGVDPAVNQLDWKAAHAVGFFHAPHFETQKAYVRQLLTHRNPYTKLAYVEDPAVALVEINNENGLIHTWMGSDFDALPEVFAEDLRKQWNDWLGKRYTDTAALSRAWGARDEPLGAEMFANAGLVQRLEGWNVEQHQGAAVEASVENGTAILRVRKPGTAGWHVQFNQPNLAIKKGGLYTVRFRAAADRERKVNLSLIQAHDPWGNLGFGMTLTLSKDAKPFTFTFLANADDENARLNFGDMNQEGAEFRFTELSLKPGGRVGVGEGESVEQRNVRVPKVAEAWTLPAGGRHDWVRFLWETERKHWTGMQKFLKEELGVKVPIVGTIVATSTPNLMADMDVVDTHAYWEHPHFPGKPWDWNNWFVNNLSMVNDPERATVTALAFQRVAGKPHMVSEYNHPAPNTHAGEGPLFIAAFGALQDWDAIFLYTYSHDDGKTKAGRIPDFFDIGQHPTIMANVPAASLLFRRGDVAAARQVLRLPLSPEAEVERIAQKGHTWNVLNVRQLGLDLRYAIRHRVALDLTGKSAVPDMEALALDAVTSDTGEIAWRLPTQDKGVFEIRSPRTKGFIGHADGQTLDLGDGVQVTIEKTRTGWCTLALTLLEGESLSVKPRRALLVATGYTENTDMGWTDLTKSTVGTNWGKPPSLIAPV
ncbi:MAG: carbohydrate binding domain-containing protein, partial [Thermoguttaceae bacterium]|nr:carbohydrate binding domain-containing protein [Thermoguttaceae bacterium]